MRIVVWTTVFEKSVVADLNAVAGVEVFVPASRDAFIDALADADGVVMMGGLQSYAEDTATAVHESRRLKWIQLISAGYEGLEAHGLPDHVALTGPGEGISSAVAEHAMALLWALIRGLSVAAIQQAERRWDRAYSTRTGLIAGKTLLVLGLGDIGRKASTMAAALGMRVIGVSHSGRPVHGPHEVRKAAELPQLLPEADAIVLALPLRAETRHILDAEALARCKAGALVVNVGRGELIDQPALLEALQNGHIGGAGLDVMTPEPLPSDDPLWSAPNLILTPHVGGAGDREGMKRISAAVAENARRLVAGEPLLNPVKFAG